MSKIHNSGADLTDFTEIGWQAFKDELGLLYEGRAQQSKAFLCKSNKMDLIVATANNPETGEYSTGNRKPEVNYASYMGARGSTEAIFDWQVAMLKHAEYIKSGDSFSDDYIGVD